MARARYTLMLRCSPMPDPLPPAYSLFEVTWMSTPDLIARYQLWQISHRFDAPATIDLLRSEMRIRGLDV